MTSTPASSSRGFVKRLGLASVLFASSASTALAGKHGEAVIAAQHALADALLKADAKAVAELTADELRYIHSTGRLETKAMFAGGIASGEIKYEQMKVSDLVAAEITPNVAVLSGKIDQRKFNSGRWGEVKLLFHSVWREESGAWRLVSLQTVLPPPPAPRP